MGCVRLVLGRIRSCGADSLWIGRREESSLRREGVEEEVPSDEASRSGSSAVPNNRLRLTWADGSAEGLGVTAS